jgi:DNA helicase HerA-like ATPase
MGRPLGPVNVARDVLNRHCFITGMSGSGKSNTAVQIILEAYNKLGVPFMVLEPAKAEYRQLARAPELQGKMRVFAIGGEADAGTTPGASTSGSQGAESLPFRLNPLAFVPGVPLGRHIDLLKAVFNASFPMFAGMSYVLEEAIIEVYTERGWSLYTSRNEFLDERAGQDEQAALMPSLQDLHDKIEVVLERKKYGAEIAQNMGAALRSRLKSLLVGNRGMVLNTRRSTPLRLLFEAPAAFEMQNLGDDEEKAFVMALLFVLLYEYAEVRGRDMPPSRRGVLQHITLIEEAHRLLAASHGGGSAETGDPRGKAVAMFTDMLAEMRAYGEGFIMADQIPTKLAPETLKNSSLKIVHRLAAPDDRQIAGECMSLSPEQVRHLNSLAPGQAIVHDHRLGEAVQVKIHAAKDQRSALAAQAQKQATQVLADSTPRPRYTYLHRDAGCRECPAPCTFLHRLLDAPDQKEHFQALRPFFESLIFNDGPAAWPRWEAWRSQWRHSRAMRGLDDKSEAAIGVTYCAATRAAHEWLGAVLSARNAAFGERDLQPPDRLAREAAARALCELVMAWVRAPDQEAALSADSTALYQKVRAQVLGSVADAPPREKSGCPSCPARCRLLPFTAPHLLKLDKTVAPILEAPTSARDKLGAIDAAIAHGRAIPLLARQEAAPDAAATRRHWIYCLLTNLPTPQKSAAAARGRDEVLALILSAEAAST